MKQGILKCATCKTSRIFSGMVVSCNQQNTLFRTISCFGPVNLTGHFKSEWSVCHCYYNPQCAASVHRPAPSAAVRRRPPPSGYSGWECVYLPKAISELGHYWQFPVFLLFFILYRRDEGKGQRKQPKTESQNQRGQSKEKLLRHWDGDGSKIRWQFIIAV